METLFINKGGLATREVAKLLMGFEAGDRLPTVTQLAQLLGTARGNIESALANLKKLEAIALKARGHMGTYLVSINYMRLAEICGVKGLVGAMPLPYSKKFEGLATGLYDVLNTGGLRSHIVFMRGSAHRLEQLLECRYDFVVMSQLALDNYIEEGQPLTGLANFGAGSYVDKHVVMVRDDFDGLWQNKRVGVDQNSIDHRTLTRQFFAGRPVEFVPLAYNQLLSLLHSGEIDACVWNADAADFNGIAAYYEGENPLSSLATQAVLACRKEDAVAHRLLQQVMDTRAVCEVQKQVMWGKRPPQY